MFTGIVEELGTREQCGLAAFDRVQRVSSKT